MRQNQSSIRSVWLRLSIRTSHRPFLVPLMSKKAASLKNLSQSRIVPAVDPGTNLAMKALQADPVLLDRVEHDIKQPPPSLNRRRRRRRRRRFFMLSALAHALLLKTDC
jgi:hypothetical protein